MNNGGEPETNKAPSNYEQWWDPGPLCIGYGRV